jgi:hypothetical protein
VYVGIGVAVGGIVTVGVGVGVLVGVGVGVSGDEQVPKLVIIILACSVTLQANISTKFPPLTGMVLEIPLQSE